MSRYRYDYSLTPSRPTGWRSAFSDVLLVGAIAAVSAISGGVVALDLLGSETPAERTPIAAPIRIAPVATPRTAQSSAPITLNAAVVQPQAPAAPAVPKAAAAPAPKAAPAAATAPAPERAAAAVPESELTFTQGYARRRAVQAAADTASNSKVEVASQVGRSAPKVVRTRTVARAYDQRRVAEAREEGFFGQPNRFDFGRHQALAFGDSRESRATRRPPSQQGGFFGGMF